MKQIAVLLEQAVVMDDNSNRNFVLTDEPANTAKDYGTLVFHNRVIRSHWLLPVGDSGIERSALALVDVVV